jgi:ABC-type molybdenum transport system ATPase subunit/photorepair protein PhrA
MLLSQRKIAEEKAGKLQKRSELLQKSSDVFKNWLDDSLRENVGVISDLVTTGLQHIIHDQKLVFKIKQEMKFNRLSMRFIIEENGVEGDPMASFGGGAVLTASFILRLAIMSRLGMGNLLLLDESMHALANKYVPAAASFMRQLSEQTGINILMVTHNEEFLNHAHISYEGQKNDSLQLFSRKITNDT